MSRKNAAILLGIPLGLCAVAGAQAADSWVTVIDAANYGASGTITFNDWGYTGPQGADASTFAITSPVTGITGFDATRIGQTQTVTTLDPDWNTPDPAITLNATRSNASQDAQVNFGYNMYTTVGGSTFTDMQIDKAGNYFVAENNMDFQFYDVFKYHDATGVKPDATVDTAINFQPYAISDARGWCGSTLTEDPNGLGIMAGQVTFDFAFDAYFGDGNASPAGSEAIQLVPDFVMRSYGSYVLDVTSNTGIRSYYTGSAVMNNNNPTISPLDANGNVTGNALDPNYQNRVSFLGAGTVPKGVWVTADSYDENGNRVLNPDGTWNVTIVDGENSLCDPNNLGAPPVAGAVCHENYFGGFSFLLRADGQRTLTYISPTGHSDYISSVPVPAAAWLLGSGLIGLIGVARRKV